MLTDFAHATAQIEHHGAKGRERESLVVKNYLERYLPNNVRATHGAEIVDSEGSRSAECDIVVEDISTPPLYLGETFKLIPAEWAHSLIEVKSRLDSDELEDSHRKIVRAKALRKLTYMPQQGDIRLGIDAYGKRFNHFPMYGAIFAFTGLKLSTIGRRLWDLQKGTPTESWVDFVVVLDQGVLLYSDPTNAGAPPLVRPLPSSSLHVVKSENALIPATLALQGALTGAFMPHARLGPYLGKEAWGEITQTISSSSEALAEA